MEQTTANHGVLPFAEMARLVRQTIEADAVNFGLLIDVSHPEPRR